MLIQSDEAKNIAFSTEDEQQDTLTEKRRNRGHLIQDTGNAHSLVAPSTEGPSDFGGSVWHLEMGKTAKPAALTLQVFADAPHVVAGAPVRVWNTKVRIVRC